MSSLLKWMEKRSGGRKKSSIVVPATFGNIEELKITKLYDEKKRFIENRMTARAKHQLEYFPDDKGINGEKSAGDEAVRHIIEETAFYGGMLGEHHPMQREQFEALMRIRLCAESLQAEYGRDNPFTQDVVRLLRTGKDNIEPFTITRGDVDLERVTVSGQGEQGLFDGVKIDLSGNPNQSKDDVEKIKDQRRKLEELEQ